MMMVQVGGVQPHTGSGWVTVHYMVAPPVPALLGRLVSTGMPPAPGRRGRSLTTPS